MLSHCWWRRAGRAIGCCRSQGHLNGTPATWPPSWGRPCAKLPCNPRSPLQAENNGGWSQIRTELEAAQYQNNTKGASCSQSFITHNNPQVAPQKSFLRTLSIKRWHNATWQLELKGLEGEMWVWIKSIIYSRIWQHCPSWHRQLKFLLHSKHCSDGPK